jgi:hypothetical protein
MKTLYVAQSIILKRRDARLTLRSINLSFVIDMSIGLNYSNVPILYYRPGAQTRLDCVLKIYVFIKGISFFWC